MKTGCYGLVGTLACLIVVAGARAWQQPYLPSPPPLALPGATSPTPLPELPMPPGEVRQADFKTSSVTPITPLKKAEKTFSPGPIVPVGTAAPMPPSLPKVPPALESAPADTSAAMPLVPASPPAPLNPTNATPLEFKSQPSVADTDVQPKVAPALTIEWLPAQNAKLHQPFTCQLLVRNTSSVAVQRVEVRQPLPQGVSHVTSEPKANVEDRQLVWQLGTLEAGQTRKIDVQLQAQARGTIHCQAQVTFNATVGGAVQVREPLLVLKTKGPEKSLVGESVTVQLVLSNPGDGLTENIKIKTVLSEGLDHSRGRTFEVPVGQLKPKETRTLQLAVQAKAGGKQEATFTVSADGNLRASDAATVEILAPRLEMELAGPKLRYVDRPAQFALKISNRGTAASGAVAVSEVIPAGFKFHAASHQGKFDEGTRTVTWALADLGPGQKQEVNLELVAAKPGEHRLVAQANSGRAPRVEAQAVTRVEGLSNLQIELVDKDDPVEVGAETQLEIRVANAGTQAESNLQLTCTLPSNVEFRSARNAANLPHRVDGGTIVFEALPKLAPRGDILYRITVRCLQPGTVRWQASLRADSMSEPLHQEESTRIYNDQ